MSEPGSRRVEVRVAGDSSALLRTMFGDANYLVEPVTTSFVTEVPDEAALSDLCHRIRDSGIELVGLRRVDDPLD